MFSLVALLPPTGAAHHVTYTREVNYIGHCQGDRLCDAMSLIYDLDHNSQVTVVFAQGSDIAAQFHGKACTFHREAGLIVGVDCREWRFRAGHSGNSDAATE